MVIKIRQQQMDELAASRRDAFARRMVVHLQEDFSDQLVELHVTPENIEQFVLGGISSAKRYGVVQEGDVHLYIECTATFGPQFDRDERTRWAGEILGREDLDGEQKMDEINKHMLFGLDQPT